VSRNRLGAWLAGASLVVAFAVAPAAAQEVIELPGQDRAINANFEEIYRVGSFDGDEWETFGEIGGTAFDAAGNLYVFDRQASRVVVVDPQGDFLRDFGDAGEGPGEFRMATQLAVMPDGRVVIADLGHRAYQIFDVNGEYVRMVGMGGGGVIRIGDLQPDRTGDALISGGGSTVMAMSAGPGAGAPEPPTSRPIERIGLSGADVVTTTIADGWLPPREAAPTTLEGPGMRFSMSMASPRTFEPNLLVGALPNGGAAFSDSSAYAIKVAGPRGGVTRVLRRPIRPRPVTERIKQAEKERRLADLEAGDGPRMRIMTSGPGGGAAQAISQDAIKEMMRGQLEQMQFYPEIPVINGLKTSWSGNIWVQRSGEQPTSAGPIDVLTTEGQYMGTFAIEAVKMPAAFGPGGMAAFIETDEFDVPTIIVKRLAPLIN